MFLLTGPTRAARAFAVGALLLLAPVAWGEPAHAQARTLPIVDEAAKDPSWQAFRKRLLGAVEKRDRQYLLSILDPNVRNQSEKTRGVAEFRKQWELDSADSPLWRELRNALHLGSAYLKRDQGPVELCAPYVLAKWPPEVEPFGHGVLVARETLVQAEPTMESRVLATLAYDIVPVIDWEVPDRTAGVKQTWVRIRHRDGEGYVPEEQIRSPVEQAACFVRGPKGWRMTAFAPAGGE
jgi:hypothetical protein